MAGPFEDKLLAESKKINDKNLSEVGNEHGRTRGAQSKGKIFLTENVREVLRVVSDGLITVREISKATNRTESATRNILAKMVLMKLLVKTNLSDNKRPHYEYKINKNWRLEENTIIDFY